MFVPVIAVFILLSVITAGEGSCGQPHRSQHIHYDATSNPGFRLWLKMEEKNTQLRASLFLNSGKTTVRENDSFVWSNTDVYTGFPNKYIKEVLGIGDKDIVRDVDITANTSMEWIICTNAFTFPAMPASNNTVVTVLVVMLVVVLAAAGAYIHRLRNSLNQLVASQFKSKTEDNSKLCCGSATRGLRLYVDVSSDSDFQLWLKMERKYTRVTLHVQGRGTNNESKTFQQGFLWHNTEDYKGFPSNQNVTNRLGITNEVILSVGITANAPIELIVCRNSFSTNAGKETKPVPFTDAGKETKPASNNTVTTEPASNNTVTTEPASNTVEVWVLVVLEVLLVVELVVVIAVADYMRHSWTNQT